MWGVFSTLQLSRYVPSGTWKPHACLLYETNQINVRFRKFTSVEFVRYFI
jgi:hypothetical protein